MGAGIIIVNERGHLLSLISYSGKYDLPKGTAEDGESPFETAQRECFEECNLWIEPKDLLYETYLNRNGTQIFIAKLPTDQEIKIKINSQSNKAEHIGFCFVTFDEFLSNTFSFLREHIKWAKLKIVY